MAKDRKFEFKDGKFVNRVSGEAIPDNEPVILFRARDKYALQVLSFYKFLSLDEHHQQAIQDRIDEFTQYSKDHPERLKEPGITGDIVLNKDKGLRLHPYWLSWWQDSNVAFDLNTPWWYSGQCVQSNRASIVAAIRATSEEHAKQLVLNAHDSKVQLEWRFIEEHPTNWSPFGSRFKRADWMQW